MNIPKVFQQVFSDGGNKDVLKLNNQNRNFFGNNPFDQLSPICVAAHFPKERRERKGFLDKSRK